MKYQIGQANRLGNRSNNQDRLMAIESDEGVLLVLADGMGGQAFGEVAAEILVEQARKAYHEAARPIARVGEFLREVMMRSHHAINDFGLRQSPPVSPGTTGVLCLIQEGVASWAHVGDSRLYLFRQGVPCYRTTDHSYVEKLYQEGKISRWEQEHHPRRNQITECLGARENEPRVALGQPLALQPDDIVLLCSDGLWGPLDDAQMGSMLLEVVDLEATLDSMAEKAEQCSYPHSDNISAVALRFIAAERQGGQDPAQPHKSGATGGDDQLQSAIAQIEQILKVYEKELGR